jgi:hypothetical protein
MPDEPGDRLHRFELAIMLSALLGCTSAPPSPPPSVEPPRVTPPAEAQRTVARVDTVETCILHGGKLIDVRVELQPTGDTTVGGRPFAEVYADTGQYAATREWYVNNEPIDYDPRNVCYMKFGLPRHVARESLVRLGEWRGAPVFRERPDDLGLPGVVWVPVYPGCSFQPYQYETRAPPTPCPRPEYRFEVP